MKNKNIEPNIKHKSTAKFVNTFSETDCNFFPTNFIYGLIPLYIIFHYIFARFENQLLLIQLPFGFL